MPLENAKDIYSEQYLSFENFLVQHLPKCTRQEKKKKKKICTIGNFFEVDVWANPEGLTILINPCEFLVYMKRLWSH